MDPDQVIHHLFQLLSLHRAPGQSTQSQTLNEPEKLALAEKTSSLGTVCLDIQASMDRLKHLELEICSHASLSGRSEEVHEQVRVQINSASTILVEVEKWLGDIRAMHEPHLAVARAAIAGELTSLEALRSMESYEPDALETLGRKLAEEFEAAVMALDNVWTASRPC